MEENTNRQAWVAYYDGIVQSISVAEYTTAEDIAEWFKAGAHKIELLPINQAKELFFSGTEGYAGIP